ncbi:MAG TPA: hypothetical protein VFQ07_17735 [Candidatus Polarisedimenticolia bacterium]|nr:hypothetical protein [Candidatus Polarisedimenticolia bacterium]
MIMNGHLGSGAAFWERGRSDRAALVVMAMAFAAIALNDGARSFTLSAGGRPRMKHFVLLFRQGPVPLPEAEQKVRADAIVAWDERQDDSGHQVEDRTLRDVRAWIGSDLAPASGSAGSGLAPASGPADDGALSSILFFEARDMAEAVEIARSHPALRYGATVEVRAWSPPGSPQ